MSSKSKSSKLLQYINYLMRVTIQDGRQLVGKFIAFDRHMNLVIDDCQEFHKLPTVKGGKKGEEREDRRTLGLVLLRGEEVISMTIEGPPPPPDENHRPKAAGPLSAPGFGWAAGRGIPLVFQPQPGLSGPVRGVGGPALVMMKPLISRPPVMGYAPPVVRPEQMLGFPGQMPRGAPLQFQRQYGQRPPQMMSLPPPAGGCPPRMPGPPLVVARPGMPPAGVFQKQQQECLRVAWYRANMADI